MQPAVLSTSIPQVIALVRGLDSWLDTMRGPAGYGGPVAHWWQNCLQFTGAGIDWRYEGIITGYLNLYQRTGQQNWLDKACRAGDDIVRAQLPNGNFANSSFEQNPYSGGTPHEAACDLALLRLSAALDAADDERSATYRAVAERNLRDYFCSRMWDTHSRSFQDKAGVPSFVPNKAATLCQALFLLAEQIGDLRLVEDYALPTLNRLLEHQLTGEGNLAGAIYQNSFGAHTVARFFPYYVARCVPGLLAGYRWSSDRRYFTAAQQALNFVLRWRYPDGSFPQVVYARGQVNRYPQWIAAVGDILRAIHLLYNEEPTEELATAMQPTLAWLLQGRLAGGGFRTAHGFAAQISQRTPGPLPEFRDVLPVCGWSDKAFVYLTSLVDETCTVATQPPPPYELVCTFRGRRLHYAEKDGILTLQWGNTLVYCWTKGDAWANVCAPWLALK